MRHENGSGVFIFIDIEDQLLVLFIHSLFLLYLTVPPSIFHAPVRDYLYRSYPPLPHTVPQLEVPNKVIVGGINHVHLAIITDEVLGEAKRTLYLLVCRVESVDGPDCRYAAICVIHLQSFDR